VALYMRYVKYVEVDAYGHLCGFLILFCKVELWFEIFCDVGLVVDA